MSDKNEAELITIPDAPKQSLGDAMRAVLRDWSYDLTNGKFKKFWKQAPIDLRFRLTNRCNENCPHCFEYSGPHQPMNFMSPADVAHYINEMYQAPSTEIYLTGGEFSCVYDAYPHYLRDIIDRVKFNKNHRYSVQTNGRWIFGKNCDAVKSDMCLMSEKIGRTGGQLRLTTSVDRYHSPSAIGATREVLQWIATDEKMRDTKFVIMSDRLDRYMANHAVLVPDWFASRGVELKFVARDDFFNPFFQVCHANDTRVVIHEESPVMRIGRAAKNKIGYKILFPEKQCGGLAGDNKIMTLVFNEQGFCKWHEWYDWNIATPYHNPSGENKSIAQIRDELIEIAARRRLRKNIKNFAIGLIPFMEFYRDYQIKKSFEQNSAPVVIRLDRVY